MDVSTIVDVVVAAVIAVSAILAYFRGFTREVLAIAGWVVGAVIAFYFAPLAEPLIKHIPIIGEVIAGSCELSVLVSFVLLFAILLIIFSFFTPFFSSLIQQSAVSAIDQIVGLLFGIFRGALLVIIAFFVVNTVTAGNSLPEINESRSALIFNQFSEQIESGNPQATLGWITRRYEYMVGNCE